MTDFQKLTDFENLYRSYLAALRGKRKSRGTARFDADALENILLIKRQLLDRTYQISPYSEFTVSEPKKRVIKSGSFRDKVLQHCLCDFVLLPLMQPIFIRDNYAGQLGKGTLYGLNRLSENLSEFFSIHGTSGYILKCDIRKFFYSIDHDIMKQCVRKYIADPGIQWVCDLFIDSTDGLGLPLGNQCSQVFALMYLNELDHYIVEELKCRFYGRYMDDFYLISYDKDFLILCRERIQKRLEELGLSLNEKTEIVPLSKGIRFLGFHTYLTESGKVIRKLTGDRKRMIRKRLRKYSEFVRAGKMTQKEFNERYASWKNHASHGNCIKLTQSMDEFVKQLQT